MIGVVLMGGKSSRFGSDKAYFNWYGTPLYMVAYHNLSSFCDTVYLSTNKLQTFDDREHLKIIVDDFESEGPISGIVTVFRKMRSPMAILSCDMPYVTHEDISVLFNDFYKKQYISLFYNSLESCYEPLLSIWNVEALFQLDQYFAEGNRSLNHFLKLQNTPKIPPPDIHNLVSINMISDLPHADL